MMNGLTNRVVRHLGLAALCRALASRRAGLPWTAAVLAATILTAPSSAQVTSRPAADPADVGSIDAIMAAVYDVISGPAGQQRDWDRMRSLFAPGARLMPTSRDSTGMWRTATLSVDDWIANADPFFRQTGFFERELHSVAERFGNIAHVFSTYDSKRSPDAEPFARGINSFQLMYDGARWWVVSIFWQGETPEHPIPGKYLPGR